MGPKTSVFRQFNSHRNLPSNASEQYVCEEVGDSWKYNYRPCCESLFLTLFHEFRETLAPFLIDQLRQCDDKTSTQDLAAILRKDAVYNAVGLVAFELFD